MPYSRKTFLLTLDAEKYKFDFSSYPIVVTLVPYDGSPQIFVNGDVLPVTLDGYLWQTEQGLEQRLVLFPEERRNAGLSDKLFYITVSTYWQESMFTLKAYPVHKQDIFLSFNFPEAGTLAPGEADNYHFVMYGMRGANVTVDLARKQGNPNLFVKRCSSSA